MEEKKKTEVLKQAISKHGEQLLELLKTYDLAVLGYDMQEQLHKDIYTKVLSQNYFWAAYKCEAFGIKVGDRITEEEHSYLLSEKDFQDLQVLAHPLLVKVGVTDEKGYYITNWLEIKGNARRALVEFIILRIMPAEFKDTLWSIRTNIVQTDKLINAVRLLVPSV